LSYRRKWHFASDKSRFRQWAVIDNNAIKRLEQIAVAPLSLIAVQSFA
jgi:hypothetical protein